MKQDGGIYLLYHSGTKGSIMAAGGIITATKRLNRGSRRGPIMAARGLYNSGRLYHGVEVGESPERPYRSGMRDFIMAAGQSLYVGADPIME